MTKPDFVNGFFEVTGSLAIWTNVFQLLRDKQIKGTRWEMMIFFTGWGYWNCFFYPHLHQWMSFIGGLSLAFANTIWTILAMYYLYWRKS